MFVPLAQAAFDEWGIVGQYFKAQVLGDQGLRCTPEIRIGQRTEPALICFALEPCFAIGVIPGPTISGAMNSDLGQDQGMGFFHP